MNKDTHQPVGYTHHSASLFEFLRTLLVRNGLPGCRKALVGLTLSAEEAQEAAQLGRTSFGASVELSGEACDKLAGLAGVSPDSFAKEGKDTLQLFRKLHAIVGDYLWRGHPWLIDHPEFGESITGFDSRLRLYRRTTLQMRLRGNILSIRCSIADLGAEGQSAYRKTERLEALNPLGFDDLDGYAGQWVNMAFGEPEKLTEEMRHLLAAPFTFECYLRPLEVAAPEQDAAAEAGARSDLMTQIQGRVSSEPPVEVDASAVSGADARDLLEDAKKTIDNRASEYDRNHQEERSFPEIARRFNQRTGLNINARQAVVFLQVLKQVRRDTAPFFHRDSFVDEACYLALEAEYAQQGMPVRTGGEEQ